MARAGLPQDFFIEILDPFQLEGGLTLKVGFWRRERAYQHELQGDDYWFLASAGLYALDPETQLTEQPGFTISEWDVVHGIACGRMRIFAYMDDRWPEVPGVSVEQSLMQLIANVWELRRLAHYDIGHMAVFDARDEHGDHLVLANMPRDALPEPHHDMFADRFADRELEERLKRVFQASIDRYSQKTGKVDGLLVAEYSPGFGFTGTATRLILDLTKAERLALVFNDLLEAAGAYGAQTADHRRGIILYAGGKGDVVVDQGGMMIGENVAVALSVRGFSVERTTRVEDAALQLFKAKIPTATKITGVILEDMDRVSKDPTHLLHRFAVDLLEGAAEGSDGGWGKPVQ